MNTLCPCIAGADPDFSEAMGHCRCTTDKLEFAHAQTIAQRARHRPVVPETARAVYRSSPAFIRVYFHGHPIANASYTCTDLGWKGGGGGGGGMGPAFHPPGSTPV